VNVASGAVSGRDGVLKLPRRNFLHLAAGAAALPGPVLGAPIYEYTA
jgi:hypothetical protein